MTDVTRRQFLAGALVVFAVPKTLGDMDWERLSAPLDYNAVPGFESHRWPFEIGLTSYGEECTAPGRQPLSFGPASEGVTLNDTEVRWESFEQTAYVDGARLYYRGDLVLATPVAMNTHYVVAGCTVSFPVGSIAITGRHVEGVV